MTAPTLAPVTADNWTAHAACRDTDPDQWFSPRAEAKNLCAPVCAFCPVRAWCRADTEAMPRHLRYTGQYRTGLWWPARSYGARGNTHRQATANPKETR